MNIKLYEREFFVLFVAACSIFIPNQSLRANEVGLQTTKMEIKETMQKVGPFKFDSGKMEKDIANTKYAHVVLGTAELNFMKSNGKVDTLGSFVWELMLTPGDEGKYSIGNKVGFDFPSKRWPIKSNAEQAFINLEMELTEEGLKDINAVFSDSDFAAANSVRLSSQMYKKLLEYEYSNAEKLKNAIAFSVDNFMKYAFKHSAAFIPEMMKNYPKNLEKVAPLKSSN